MEHAVAPGTRPKLPYQAHAHRRTVWLNSSPLHKPILNAHNSRYLQTITVNDDVCDDSSSSVPCVVVVVRVRKTTNDDPKTHQHAVPEPDPSGPAIATCSLPNPARASPLQHTHTRTHMHIHAKTHPHTHTNTHTKTRLYSCNTGRTYTQPHKRCYNATQTILVTTATFSKLCGTAHQNRAGRTRSHHTPRKCTCTREMKTASSQARAPGQPRWPLHSHRALHESRRMTTSRRRRRYLQYNSRCTGHQPTRQNSCCDLHSRGRRARTHTDLRASSRHMVAVLRRFALGRQRLVPIITRHNGKQSSVIEDTPRAAPPLRTSAS